MGWTVYDSSGNLLSSIALVDNVVATAKIADDAVTYAKLQNLGTANRVLGSASTGLIGEVEVATNMIANDAVTYVKMQDLATADRVLGSESTGVIGEVQIVPDMIASDAVTTVKILDDQVTYAKLQDLGTANRLLGGTSTGTIGEVQVAAAMIASATLATVGETNTGTDATKIITPDILAGSNYGERVVQLVVVDFTTDVAVANTGKFWFVVPSTLHGMDLVEVSMNVITAGVTGNTDVMIYNLTDTADMLSAAMRIETTDLSTTQSAQPGTINTDGTKSVVTSDVLRIDIDTIQTGTAPKGLIVTMIFRIP